MNEEEVNNNDVRYCECDKCGYMYIELDPLIFVLDCPSCDHDIVNVSNENISGKKLTPEAQKMVDDFYKAKAEKEKNKNNQVGEKAKFSEVAEEFIDCLRKRLNKSISSNSRQEIITLLRNRLSEIKGVGENINFDE